MLHGGIKGFNKGMEKIIDQVTKAHPGDIVIVKVTNPLTEEQKETLKSQISMLDKSGVKFLIWDAGDIEIGVISKGFADNGDNKSDGTANK